MSPYELAKLLRDHLAKGDASHIEARSDGKLATIRFWRRDGSLVREVALTLLLSLCGACGNAYEVAPPEVLHQVEPQEAGAHDAAKSDADAMGDAANCGALGQACCLAADRRPELCTDPATTCNDNGDDAVCVSCGALGEPCCMGACSAGTCAAKADGSWCE